MPEIGVYDPTIGRTTSGEEDAAMQAFKVGLLEHGESVQNYYHGERCQQPNAVMFGWGKSRHMEVVEGQKLIGGRVLGINFGALRRERGYYVIGWDGLNNSGCYYNQASESGRWHKLGLSISPWRSSHGKKVVLACQVPTDGSVSSIDIVEWCQRMVSEIRGFTDREIIFRPHPLARSITPSISGATRSERDFREDLKESWAVVTYNSTSSGFAVLDGVPVFTFNDQSFAWDVSLHNVESIESPLLCDREQWAYDLAYTQWTLDEMRSGKAWDWLKRGAS